MSSTMPHRDRYLFVCTNRREEGHPKGSCAQKGSEAIIKVLKESLLRVGGARAVRACSSSCLDMCETGISIVVEPDHVVYGGVTMADVEEIAVAAKEGKIVERLVVARKSSEKMRENEPMSPLGSLEKKPEA